MNIALTTTFNKKILMKYGYRFIQTYNWKFPVFVYSEDADLEDYLKSKVKNKDLLNKINEQYKFLSLHDEVPESLDFVKRNKDRAVDRGDDKYRYDGVKFSYKVFAYTHFIENNVDKYDGLIGIDADSVFHQAIDHKWIKKYIHKDNTMMTFLGRGDKNPKAKGPGGYPTYSECGFLYFNSAHEKTKDYALEMKRMYTSDDIYKEREYHDSWIWDVVRKRFEKSYDVKNHDIGDDGWGQSGHVQARSVLANVYDHTKGPNKKFGYSKHREMFKDIARSKL
jgi:hypothetical protein